VSYPIAQRPSEALYHARACIRAGLAAQITAINADLTSRSRPWRVPVPDTAAPIWTVAEGVIVRLQEPDLPSGLTYPQVRLVHGSLVDRQDTSGRGGLGDTGLSVACYLDAVSVARANAVASLSGEITEELLAFALLDFADAVARTLRDPVSGLYDATSGIVQISADLTRAPADPPSPRPWRAGLGGVVRARGPLHPRIHLLGRRPPSWPTTSESA
jgi:hypothetical protein